MMKIFMKIDEIKGSATDTEANAMGRSQAPFTSGYDLATAEQI